MAYDILLPHKMAFSTFETFPHTFSFPVINCYYTHLSASKKRLSINGRPHDLLFGIVWSLSDRHPSSHLIEHRPETTFPVSVSAQLPCTPSKNFENT